MLDAVSALLIKQPLGATEPAACTPDLPPTGEVDAQPECAAERGQRLAASKVGAMALALVMVPMSFIGSMLTQVAVPVQVYEIASRLYGSTRASLYVGQAIR